MIKQYLDKLASGRANKKGQMASVTALLLALIGGLIVAIFHTGTVEPVSDAAHNASTNTNVSSGAESLLNQYDLIYVAAGLIGFFVLIMNAAT